MTTRFLSCAFAVSILSSLAGCSAEQGAPVQEAETEEALNGNGATCATNMQNPADLPGAIARSFNRGKKGEIGGCYTMNAQLVGSQVPVVVGKDDIVKTYADWQAAKLKVSFWSESVDVADKDAKFANILGAYKTYDESHKQIDQGKFIIHAEYVNGRWLAGIDTFMSVK